MKVYISKSDSFLEINWEGMPKNAQDHIIMYGLKQKLNDAGSSATTKELGADAGPQALAMAENVLKALMAGDVSVRASAKSQTLEERVMTRVIRSVFKAICKKNVSKEEDQSDESLLEQIVKISGKDIEAVQSAIQKRVSAEIAIERTKAELPSIEL